MNDVAPTAPRTSAPPRTMPVFSVSVKLNTEFAQRVYKRCFDRLKADLYVLTVRTRAGGMDEAAKAIETILSEAFGSVRKDLDSELERSDALLDDVKLTDLAEYDGVPTIKAAYSTPRAKEFLDLLLKMDQLLMRYDALWLSGHIETQQRWARCQNWQRRLTKVANRLRELGNRTRTGLTREAEKRVQAGSATPAAGPAAQNEPAPPAATAAVETDDLDSEAPDTLDEVPEEFRDPADRAPTAEGDTVSQLHEESAAATLSEPDAQTPSRPRTRSRRIAEAATG
jgi:hypothetical protein